MVSIKTERRHRLNPVEVDPILEAVYPRLIQLMEEKEDLPTAEILFRVYFRLREYVTYRQKSAPCNTWSEIRSYLNDTV